MNDKPIPVKACKVGIPIMSGPLNDRTQTTGTLLPAIFLYTKVGELLVRCAEAGVVLLEDPTKLTDAS